MKVYLISALKHSGVVHLGNKLRKLGFDVFDDWYAAGPEADDYWAKYEKARGRTYTEALEGWHAKHVFALDYQHLLQADVGILLLPASRSAHLEAGFLAGQGKPVFVLMEEGQDRWDVMYLLLTKVFTDEDDLLEHMKELLDGTE